MSPQTDVVLDINGPVGGSSAPIVDMSYLDALLPDFEPVPLAPTRRVVASIWGSQKVGKSTFALSFPRPLIVHNFDYGIQELLVRDPELAPYVRIRNHQMNEMTDPATWGKLLADFHASYIQSLEAADKTGGTVIVDTATQLWQIVQSVLIEDVRAARLANAEKRIYKTDIQRDEAIDRAQKPSQMDYGKANAFMGGLLRRAMQTTNASAVFINRAKETYTSGGQKTGEIEYHGFGETPAITQVHLKMLKEGGTYYTLINNCRFDGSIEGMKLKDPSYSLLADLIFPGAE